MKIKLFLSALILTIISKAQTCQDGFETNSFNGWNGAIGTNAGNYSVNITSYGISAPNFGIETSTTIPCSNTNSNPTIYQPLPAPGFGQYSARLGEVSIAGGKVEMITYTFTPTVNDTDFLYSYSTYLQAPGHGPSDNPYFIIGMLDQNGDTIPGSFYKYETGTPSTLGFDTSACTGLFFKPWTIRGVNLTPYVGQQVVLFAVNADCSFMGHYAYSYIDIDCDGLLDIPLQSSVVLNARSEDGSSYLWNTGATTYSILVNNPVPNSIYTCTVTLSSNFAPTGANSFVVKYQIIGTTNIEQNFDDENYLFYPNPGSDIIYIKDMNKHNEIEMYDILGNRVNIKFNGNNSFDVSKIPNGVYFIRLKDNNNTYKIVIQH